MLIGYLPPLTFHFPYPSASNPHFINLEADYEKKVSRVLVEYGRLFHVYLLLERKFITIDLDGDRLLVVDFATDDTLAELVEEFVLNGSLDRTGTKLRVEACLGDEGDGLIGDLERDAILGDHLDDLINLQTDNLLDFCLVEGREGDDVVDSVEELWTEMLRSWSR